MKHTIYIMYRAARAAARTASTRAARTAGTCAAQMTSTCAAAPMASLRAALLLVVTLLLAAACTNEQDLPAPIAPDGYPADGRLGIGQLLVSGNNPDDYRSRKPLEGADTRIGKGATDWEAGDYIRVTATARTGDTLVAYYEYQADGTWKQQDVFSSLPPEVIPNNTYPLYIDDIDRSQPIRVESWGGGLYDQEKENPTKYTDQGSFSNGSRYYWNDHILCPSATLHTTTDAANGITRGSLTGTLAHQRVDVVVHVLTDDAHPLGTITDVDATQLRLILPDKYGVATADGSVATTPGSTATAPGSVATAPGSATTGSTGIGSTPTLRTWMSASTPADAAAGKKAYTTFRAYVKLADLPGASAPQQDEQGDYVTIGKASKLGTLAYSTTVGSGKLPLRYSVKSATDAQPTRVRPGTRLTLEVDFTVLQNPVLTATLSPWQNEEGGDLPTYPETAAGNGTQPLDAEMFNASHPNWIVTGGGTPEADALVAKNVRQALNRIYNPLKEDGDWNADTYTGSARIDLILPEVSTLPTWYDGEWDAGAFQKYQQLRSVSLPAAKTIGVNAFLSCTNLTTLSLPVATTIGESAINNCTALSTLSLPKVDSIGKRVFQNCTALTDIDLPVATTIEDNAFLNCNKLTTANLPVATTIGDNAFQNCFMLTTRSLPKAKTIGVNAFKRCAKLTTLSLPAATSIGSNAFITCDDLTTLRLTAAEDITLQTDALSGFNTEACTLVLHPNKQPAAGSTSNQWEGKTWQAITYAEE